MDPLPSILVFATVVPSEQGLVEVAMRQGGFALAALVLFFGLKYLWRRFVKNDDARVKELTDRVGAQDREIRAAAKKREDEISGMRDREYRDRGELQRAVDQARRSLESERARSAESMLDLSQQLAAINEVRVAEAMQVVRAAESLRDTNDIVEKLLHALAERACRAEHLASKLAGSALGDGRADHAGTADAGPTSEDPK